MALVLNMKIGGHFYVDGHRIQIAGVKNGATLRRMDGSEIFIPKNDHVYPLFPSVRVGVGLRSTASTIQLLIEAPETVSITRD